MSLISRITTWTSQILTSSSLNGEFNNIVNTINNLDGATTPWTNVKVGALTSTVSTALKGTTTNDSAAAGNIGEYITATFSGSSFPTSTTYGDLGNIALTGGDWDISLVTVTQTLSATISLVITGLSTTTGNSATGLTFADNAAYGNAGSLGANAYMLLTIPSWRLSLSGASTVYIKTNATFTGSPSISGRVSARRIR